MEGENMFMNESNNSFLPFQMAMQNEQLGTPEQLQNCFFNPNWGNSVDQNDTFESALSSMVSSPVASNAAGGGENIVLRELIGRLGGICNSGKNSTTNSCYNTPMNSPPKLNLAMMEHQVRGNVGNLPFPGSHLPDHPSLGLIAQEPGFAERAARYSCLANNGLNGLNGEPPVNVSGYQKMPVEENKDVLSIQEEKSSLSDQILAGENEGNLRKRKSISKGKGKYVHSSISCEEANAAAEKIELSTKRSKINDNENGKCEDLNGKKDGKDNGNKKENKDDQRTSEPLKDYIHVRARRGQATDAHSLAERVRREKISQKMKFLQDLVPGCNKVTGKAVMLDEIINYVQSLQRQVEFLSMKLATINPGTDVNIETLLSSKDILQNGPYQSDNPGSAFPFLFQSQQLQNLHAAIPNISEMALLPSLNEAAMGRTRGMQEPLGGCYSEAAPQASSVWEDDLQSVVFGQNQTHNFYGLVAPGTQMKVEK